MWCTTVGNAGNYVTAASACASAAAAAGPFLTPLYGCGELPQAFCRSAAVGGAVQVLRCGIEGLVFDEHTFTCIGVELASGQVCAWCVSAAAMHLEKLDGLRAMAWRFEHMYCG